MRGRVLSLWVLVVGAGCGGPDEGRGNDGSCTPGEQVACPCGDGPIGVQVCNSGGAGFGACMGCGDESTGAPSSSSGSSDPITSSTTPTTDAESTTSTSALTDDGASTSNLETTASPLIWAWVDHGGPAYLPHACDGAAGVVDGVLVDPQAFFESLVAGRDPNDWEAVLNEIEPSLWACGIGQQRNSGGEVRGRLFLPTDACPDAAPPADDAMAMFLGVRQEPACWDHAVDVLADA
jgi:hypothetical protein